MDNATHHDKSTSEYVTLIDITVIIPAYNEAILLQSTLRDTLDWLEGSGLTYQIVVVDDGSSDETHNIAKDFDAQGDKICSVRLSRNAGKGFALKFGMAFAEGAKVAFLDADMDIHPSHLGVLWQEMERTGAHGVIGSKQHPDAQVRGPFSRRVLSLGYFLAIWLLFGLPVHDTQTGIKLFDRELLTHTMPRVLIKRFAFDLELLACANRLGYHIVDVPVQVLSSRPHTRISWTDVRTVGLDTLAIFYRLYIQRYYDD